MRHRALLIVLLVAAAVAGLLAAPALRARLASAVPRHVSQSGEAGGGPPTTPPGHLQGAFQKAPPQPRLQAPADLSSITASGTSLFGWALLDRTTGTVAGSANAATVKNTVESMIKPWIASD